MHRRWSKRTPLTLPVTVYRGRGAPLRVTARDLSIGGMFLQMDPDDLMPNDTVILAFTLRTEAEVSHCRLPASVMHVADDGVGVLFDSFDRNVVEVLRAVLHAPSSYQMGRGIAQPIDRGEGGLGS